MQTKSCTIPLSSMTYAMKGEELLRSRGIPSRAVRLPKDMTENGCGYGLLLSCGQLSGAKRVLGAAGIPMGRLKAGR